MSLLAFDCISQKLHESEVDRLKGEKTEFAVPHFLRTNRSSRLCHFPSDDRRLGLVR